MDRALHECGAEETFASKTAAWSQEISGLEFRRYRVY